MEGKAVVAALLTTLLLPLLLTHQSRAIVADHLSVGSSGTTAALFDACSGFLDLLSRRNMILLCNAILLVVLRDAGLLASPADARHDGGDGGGAADSPVAASKASSRRRPHKTRSDIVVWRPTKLAVVAVLDADDNDGDDRLRRRRPTQRQEPATATTMAPSALPPAPAGEEKLSYDGLDDDHVSAGAIVVVDDVKISSPVPDSDHHRYSGENTYGRAYDEEEALDQCGGGGDDDDDVDDMNRRFEEFIANTKRKMQMESLQLQLVMKV
uniref:DUF4408 domain-containing protein n=1 Tax=Oryza punctata TaxID=4537 RepID=A0A0E0KF01_ORYPU